MISRRISAVLVSLGVAVQATCAPAAITEDGRFGRALHPTETYAAAAPLGAMYFTTPRTIEFWSKIGSHDDYQVLLAYEPRSSIEHWEIIADHKTGNLCAVMAGYRPLSVLSNVNIADNQWHYIAETFDGSLLRLFVDAKPVAEGKINRIQGWSDAGSLMFGHNEGTAPPKDMWLDEVRISRGVRAIDHVPDQPFTADNDTVGLWHFDEPSNKDQFADSSVHNNRARVATGDAEFSGVNPVNTRWQAEDHGLFFSSSLTSNRPAPNDTNKAISIALGPDRKAAVAFDTELLRMSAAWTGGFMQIYGGREGLGQHPNPQGKVEFGCLATPGWSDTGKFEDPRPDHAGPLPRTQGRYKGLYLNGDRVIVSYNVFGADVLETYDVTADDKQHALIRTLELGPSDKTLMMNVVDQGGSVVAGSTNNIVGLVHKDELLAVEILSDQAHLLADKDRIRVVFPPHKALLRCRLLVGKLAAADGLQSFDAFVHEPEKVPRSAATLPATLPATSAASETQPSSQPAATLARSLNQPAATRPAEVDDIAALTEGGPRLWDDAPVTQGVLGKGEGPLVVDTLTPPYENPYKSYLRFSGIDFFKNGDAAVCSISGDVWIVSGIDAGLQKLTWRRYATGLFQPLGVRIVNDEVYVLGRDQITRLHDRNKDGEADFYENFNNDCKVTPGGHEFCTDLQTDPAGNFYYTKCGSPTDHGGTMLKVSADGTTLSVFAMGLRNPNGMGISSTGVITTSDNEGEWVPASRVDFVHAGEFLGFTPEAHGHTVDGPGFPIWIPHSLDNSSGGQIWADTTQWGSLNGALLHTSYGASAMYLLMPEVVNGKFQGGVLKLPLKFDSGIMRGRFRPADGQLYVCGLKGWQTNGIRDAALQRVRFTNKPVTIPVQVHAYQNGIRIAFACPLDPKLATDPGSWGVSQWNYRWTSAYGSHDWSVADPQKQGHDTVEVKAVQQSKDGKSVFLEITQLRPVMQMQIQYQLATPEGTLVEGDVYNTIAELRPALSPGDLEKPVESGITPSAEPPRAP